jgi:hypothetical protein
MKASITLMKIAGKGIKGLPESCFKTSITLMKTFQGEAINRTDATIISLS